MSGKERVCYDSLRPELLFIETAQKAAGESGCDVDYPQVAMSQS